MTADLRYCPACAGDLEVRQAGTPASPQPVCVSCGFVLWQNPKPSVQALILRGKRNTELLLGRQTMGQSQGRWGAPGGFLNLGDEPEAAVVRECQREFDVEVRVGELLGAFTDSFAGGELALFYICQRLSGEPRPADLVDDVAWFPVAEPPELAFRSERAALTALQARLAERR